MIDYSSFKFPKLTDKARKEKLENISKKNREEIKKLFKGKCGLCGRKGEHIHHIIYRSEDKSKINDLDNLFYICLECHLKVHSNKKYWQPRLKKIRERIGKNEM